MLGSHLIIHALHRRGVRTIFSLSGNQIMPLYDACIDLGMRIVHVRHEASAVFMADAWAQVTGELGVAMVTAAPGITNGLAPLYSASQAESPVLLISGDSSVSEDGSGAFQELDQVSITTPLTKLSLRPTKVEELYPALDKAVDEALSPRRGPVHLALPFDLLLAETGFANLPEPNASTRPASGELDPGNIRKLASLLSDSKQPLILTGPTGARAHKRTLYRSLEEVLDIPVIPMESPRGLKDPSLGSLIDLIPQADVLVLAGKCLDFTLGFGRSSVLGATARIAAVDPDPQMLNRARRLLGERLVLTIQAEPGAALAALGVPLAPGKRGTWRAAVDQALKYRGAQTAEDPATSKLTPRLLCETVQAFIRTAVDPILICDGGEFGQWAQAFCEAPTRIINGMSGAIGAGICYAIAAKIAKPTSTVVVLMGDGTAGFHLMELDTAVREDAPIIAVIGNDLRWNAEHLIQLRTYGADRLIGCELAASARYHDVATALGGFGATAESAESLGSALRRASESKAPACINVAMAGEPAPVFGTNGSSSISH
ncbi:thiamine pyrophosphate-binding protein [Ottowia thiooxydans]|uniref:Acetolactate synthase-1/2/3 large subunit n=1 Tax=Ottowia thiooxydans TaxID=219182 RepID=A0ABV2QGT6_9BURK